MVETMDGVTAPMVVLVRKFVTAVYSGWVGARNLLGVLRWH